MFKPKLEVSEYLTTITDQTRLSDTKKLIELLEGITGQSPLMWSTSIIGFGSYHYKYASGHEGDTMKIGLSARKEHLVLYGVIFYNHNTKLLDQLGKYKQGKGCLYIKKLADVNLGILQEMMVTAYNQPAPAEVKQ